MTTTLIRGAQLISPGRTISEGSLLIEGGRIAKQFAAGDPLPAAELILDAEGRLVVPGFIDIHAHGAAGCDVCDGSLESLREIARAKVSEGVTTWLPTTLTEPAERLEEIAAVCAEFLADPQFCKVPGIHLEGPFINRAMAGAQNPRHVRPPDLAEWERLHRRVKVLLLSLAPEAPDALALIRNASVKGVTTSAAHTAATYSQLSAAREAGLRHLTHFGNAMSPLHHRELGVVGGGLLDDELMLEIICDFEHLSREMLQLIFKRVPVERLMLITDSTAASGRPDGPYQLGGLEVVVSGGVARLAEGGALAGSTLAFNRGFGNAAAISGLPLHELVAATSWNQARSLGLVGVGKLEPGFAADLAILDSDFNVWKTLVDGAVRFAV